MNRILRLFRRRQSLTQAREAREAAQARLRDAEMRKDKRDMGKWHKVLMRRTHDLMALELGR